MGISKSVPKCGEWKKANIHGHLAIKSCKNWQKLAKIKNVSDREKSIEF